MAQHSIDFRQLWVDRLMDIRKLPGRRSFMENFFTGPINHCHNHADHHHAGWMV
jgi:hypothetical protein